MKNLVESIEVINNSQKIFEARHGRGGMGLKISTWVIFKQALHVLVLL